MMKQNTMRLIILSLCLVSHVGTEFTMAQKGRGLAPMPNSLVPKEKLSALLGDFEGTKLSRNIHIVWLYGPEDHRGGEHDYIRIKELFVPMLKTIPKVTVDEAFQFPTDAQFEAADLIIQYLHMPDLTDPQLAAYQKYVDEGGRVVSIHESCIMRPVDRAAKYAGCIGCSWNGNASSRWSKFNHDHPVFVDNDHPAFVGLPQTLRFNDESYWKLLARKNVKIIGAVASKSNLKASSFTDVLNGEDVRGYAFWTYGSGKGKVFGTTTGHYTYTFFDPHYRLLLLRGIAWSLDEDPKPFMPLVFQDIVNEEGLVGTTDTMMDYKNRKVPGHP